MPEQDIVTTARRSEFALFVLDLRDFMEEKIREAIDDESSRPAAIGAHHGRVSALTDPAVLPPSGRQGRTRRLRRDTRDHSRDEQSRDRTGGADQPRTHHRARAYGQEPSQDVAQISVQGALATGIFRRNPGRQSHQGHARSRQAHRRKEVGTFRAREVPRISTKLP